MHTTVGPGRTTVSAIAERAGVQRHTVYAHFPDVPTLFTACTAHWDSQHPRPAPEHWDDPDPKLRRERALDELYAWYESVEQDLVLFARDAESVPSEVLESRGEWRQSVHDRLTNGRPRRKTVRAAIGHALEFETWRSLTSRQGLSRRAAVDAMLALVNSV